MDKKPSTKLPPAWNTFRFGPIVFCSEFDSGNLLNVMPTATENTQVSSMLKFDLFICNDAYDVVQADTHRTWFYFYISGVPENTSVEFTIKNMSNQTRLFSFGMRPFYRILPKLKQQWDVIQTPVSFEKTKDSFEVTFSHLFSYSSMEQTYFAFCEPFSYQECQAKLSFMERKLQSSSKIYFQRELLTVSLDGRRIDLLTITSFRNLSFEREEVIANIFPTTFSSDQRPFKAKKPSIFISARVHPGEVPSSHMLNGILDFLSNEDDPQNMALLDQFVIKIVPMLNPDGVARGHYRLDTIGQNLNRFYDDPILQMHPSIYAVKSVISKLNNVFLYLDLHAHAGKRGCFIYGNYFDSHETQAKAMLFPKLISLNTLNFNFEDCNFTEKLMLKKDKKDSSKSREGAGRVAIHRDCKGLLYSYTLECNYCCGYKINKINERYDITNKRILKETDPILDSNSSIYKRYRIVQDQQTELYVQFSQPIFNDLGKGCMISMLDLVDRNPMPRIVEKGGLETILSEIIFELQQDKEIETAAVVTTKPKKKKSSKGKSGGKKLKKADKVGSAADQQLPKSTSDKPQIIKIPKASKIKGSK